MNNFSNTTTKKSSTFGSMANPVIRRLTKNVSAVDENKASYKGIVEKTAFFLIATVVGFLLINICHNIFSGQAIHLADTENSIYDVTTSAPEMVIVGIAAVVSIICPFITWFATSAIPVVGTIYSVAQGVFIGFISLALAPSYRWISILAVVLTLSIVAVMLFVYAKRIIPVTQKFKRTISIIFISIVLGGILLFLLNLIPAIRNILSGVNDLLASPTAGIVFGIIFVIIAALFLLADFDTIEKCVTYGLDKKYEWMAAWGLAYTILYLYFKILRIIIRIVGSKGSSKK